MPITIKIGKRVAHRVGYCQNCGWVHSEIQRVRAEEGDTLVIKALCSDCMKKYKHQVICNLCGRTKCDNLYPVSILRKVITQQQSCLIFLHLCAECRKISHEEILKRLKLPDTLCDSCKNRFECFTNKEQGSYRQSYQRDGTLQGKKQPFYKTYWKK